MADIYDLSYIGGFDSQGRLNELWNREAISNSFRMWISSAQGEIVRRPTRGGNIFPLLMKPMDENQTELIQAELFTALQNDFQPYVQIQSLVVTPNYEKKYWLIEATFWCVQYKTMVDVSEKVKNFV